jgi:tetratricopeptide (TPR) repeat protein
MSESDLEQGFFNFQSPWRNIFLWNLMEVEREALIVTPAIDLELLRKIQSILIARSQRKLHIRFLVRYSEADFINSGVEPDALRILLLLGKDPSSRIEVRFAANLMSTIAVIDGRRSLMASGDLTERSMVRSINHGVLITGSDMVGGLMEDIAVLWESASTVPDEEMLAYMGRIRSRIAARSSARIGGPSTGGDFPVLERIEVSEEVAPMGMDRKEPHLDEDKKIVKELLMRARDAVEKEGYETALFYLEEAQAIKPDDLDILFEKGRVLFTCRNDLDGALDCIEKVLKRSEGHRDAWTIRGMCYQEKGDDQEALYSYDHATDIDKQHYPVWTKKGIVLGRTKGREEDGLKCLEYALEHDPYNEEAWFNKALILEQRLNRLDEAVMSYRSLLRINPGHVKGSFRLGLITLKKLKDPRKAEKYFDAVVCADPSHVHSWMFKGEIAETVRGDIPEALRCYDLARENDPKAVEILRREMDLIRRRGTDRDQSKAYELAKELLEASPKDPMGQHIAALGAYFIDRDPNAALAGLNEAIKADPSNFAAIRDKAMVLAEGLNRPEDALSLLNIARKKSPDDPMINAALGALYFEHLYDPIESLGCFDKLTQMRPGDAEAWYMRGKVLTRGLDRHQDALASLDKATSLQDGHALAWYEKGRILRSAYSMTNDAVKCFRKAQSLRSDDPEILTDLGSALLETKALDESMKTLRKALELDPARTEASIIISDVLLAKGDLEGVQQTLNAGLSHDPKSDRLWFKKALLFMSEKEVPKAMECLKRALSFNPGNIDAQNLRSELGM